MVGLNLFTQLCSLARVANASLDKPLSEDQVGPFILYMFYHILRSFWWVLSIFDCSLGLYIKRAEYVMPRDWCWGIKQAGHHLSM